MPEGRRKILDSPVLGLPLIASCASSLSAPVTDVRSDSGRFGILGHPPMTNSPIACNPASTPIVLEGWRKYQLNQCKLSDRSGGSQRGSLAAIY